MSYTQAEIDALKTAIAKGVRSVQKGDEVVTYRSIAEMERVLRMMEAEVSGAGSSRAGGRIYLSEIGRGV